MNGTVRIERAREYEAHTSTISTSPSPCVVERCFLRSFLSKIARLHRVHGTTN